MIHLPVDTSEYRLNKYNVREIIVVASGLPGVFMAGHSIRLIVWHISTSKLRNVYTREGCEESATPSLLHHPRKS